MLAKPAKHLRGLDQPEHGLNALNLDMGLTCC